MHADEVPIDEALVRRLLHDQVPDLADLPLVVLAPWGTDHAIWRVGSELVVRLPRIGWAADQPEREARTTPVLAPHLPVAIPETVALGEPAHGYPFRWSVQRRLDGEGADLGATFDPARLAIDLAEVVAALWRIPVDGAPAPRNRARPVAEYDESARRAIAGARELVDADAALALWEDALAAPPHRGGPRWVQGDLEGNCLVADGRLSGIVDWGSACAGDPAVDVQVAWSRVFTEDSRRVFLDALDVDAATIRRAKGAAVQQACAALPYYLGTYPEIVERSRHKLRALGVEVR